MNSEQCVNGNHAAPDFVIVKLFQNQSAEHHWAYACLQVDNIADLDITLTFLYNSHLKIHVALIAKLLQPS